MSERNRADAGATSFRERLQELKRSGSAILLTGETTVPARAYASRAFFGRVDEPVRRGRILIRTTPDSFPEVFLPNEVSPGDKDVRVISLPTATSVRSVSSASYDESEQRLIDDGLGPVTREVRELTAELLKVENLDSVRVGVTSLVPLLNRFDAEAVETFLGTVAADVRDYGGMAHFHLPLPDDASAVRDLASLADARVELRTGEDGTIESRWHLSGTDIDDPAWITLRRGR